MTDEIQTRGAPNTGLGRRVSDFIHENDPFGDTFCRNDVKRIEDILKSCPAQCPRMDPVAWEYELATVKSTDGKYGGWELRLRYERPSVPEGSIRNLTPLYCSCPQRGDCLDPPSTSGGAQCPSRSTIVETIHKARWPADRPCDTPFEDEDRNGREYCFRIADAVLAALGTAGAVETLSRSEAPMAGEHRARQDALEEAARIADNGCLGAPDGGSPTDDEREMCEGIASAIRARKLRGAEGVFAAPSPDVSAREALKHYSDQYCEGWCKDAPAKAHFDDCGGCKARLALAALPPEENKR